MPNTVFIIASCWGSVYSKFLVLFMGFNESKNLWHWKYSLDYYLCITFVSNETWLGSSHRESQELVFQFPVPHFLVECI